MADEKPVLDNLLEGFQVKFSLTYLKKLKKVLSES